MLETEGTLPKNQVTSDFAGSTVEPDLQSSRHLNS